MQFFLIQKSIKYFTKYVCELILLFSLAFTINQNWGEGQWQKIIHSDGMGYYAYLPAVIIYHDFNYAFLPEINRKYNIPDKIDGYIKHIDNSAIDKHFAGVALLWLPFFYLAHLLSLFFGFDTDGYSKLYMYSVSFAAIFLGDLAP